MIISLKDYLIIWIEGQHSSLCSTTVASIHILLKANAKSPTVHDIKSMQCLHVHRVR